MSLFVQIVFGGGTPSAVFRRAPLVFHRVMIVRSVSRANVFFVNYVENFVRFVTSTIA